MAGAARVRRCIYLTGFLESIIYSTSFPYFALRLRHDGIPPWLIGLNATLGTLGILAFGHLFPGLIRHFGYRTLSALGFTGAIACLAALLIPAPVWLEFVLRFILGTCQAILWVSTEAWLNHVADNATRGRTTAAFQTLYSFGFVVGPGIVYVIGYAGSPPILILIGVCVTALAVLGISGGSGHGKYEAEAKLLHWHSILRRPGAKEVLYLAVLVGICETAIYTLLPIYGIDRGLVTGPAVALLLAYTLGEVFIGYPLAWISDRANKENILTLSALVAAASILLLPAVIHSGLLAEATAFLAGGLVVTLYNVALVLLGQRFDAAILPTITTAFSMAYGVGSIAGSSFGGTSMNLFGPAGLPVAVGVSLALAGVVLLLRQVAALLHRK